MSGAKTITVGGVDVCGRFGLLLTSCTLAPPAPKTYTVDIPGGDGEVDVTEAVSGDVAYQRREMSFELFCHEGDFERAKTAVSNFLHGRRLDFSLSWDEGYTYTGRWAVDSYASVARNGTIALTVSADPYKLKERRTVAVEAAGGATVTLECGRKRQCPTFECASEFLVDWDGGTARLQAGSWRVRDLWLAQGDNELWLDSMPGQGDALISDWATKKLSSLADKRIGDLFWKTKPATDAAHTVYITYDIKEL